MEKKRGRLEREVLRVVFFSSSSSTKPLSLFLSLFRFALFSPCCLFDRLMVFGFSSFPLPLSPPQSVERKNKRRRREKSGKKEEKRQEEEEEEGEVRVSRRENLQTKREGRGKEPHRQNCHHFFRLSFLRLSLPPAPACRVPRRPTTSRATKA